MTHQQHHWLRFASEVVSRNSRADWDYAEWNSANPIGPADDDNKDVEDG